MLHLVVTASLLLVTPAMAAVRSFDFTVAPTIAAPDGMSRSILAVNGQFPGPAIVVDRGDIIQINVRNQFSQPTSLHCHGLEQRGTPFYDGVAGVTQCPIPSGGVMQYNINTADQAGTTWYHAHYMAQYVDGFKGALVIRDPEDPHQGLYDEEVIVQLSDWYHSDSGTLTQSYLSPTSQGNEPIPDSGLINGRGRYNCANAPAGSQCNSNSPLSNFNFVPGRRYRLRLINTSAFAAFKFSIDGHRLTIIEADMTPIEPITVDRLNINVAQRYSVIVTADQRPGNYWMRAKMSTACFPTQSASLDPNVLAIVNYANVPLADPTTTAMDANATPSANMDCVDLDPRLLRPLVAEPVLTPTVLLQMEVSFAADAQGINRGYINNVTYTPNLAASEVQALSTGQTQAFATTSNVYQVPLNSVVRIILSNSDTGEHPFHLHGFDFQMLAWEQGTFDPTTANLNMNNPVRRDTTTVPAQGYTVLQFNADNLGIWLFHCHIEWHVLAGLVAQIQVGTAAQFQQGIHVPPDVASQCRRQVGGNSVRPTMF